MSDPNESSGLERGFGGWTGLFVVVASMVGTGILVTSGYTIKSTQSHQTLLVLWAVGGILALAGALTVAELATALPKVGGDYIYVRDAFGPAVSFVYGWSELILGFAAPTALLALAAVDYLAIPFRGMLQTLPVGLGSETFFDPLLASCLIAGFTWTHCLSRKRSSWVQASTTIFKILTLLALTILGLWVGEGDWSYFSVGKSITDQEPAVLASSLAWIMFGYLGWNAAIYIAGEIRDPPRLLPRCLIGGCLLVTLLYLAINVTYGYALDPRLVAEMAPDEVKPVAKLAAQRLFGERVSSPLSVLIGLGVLASLSAYLLLGPRVSYAMACDGIFPSYTGKLHPVYGTPFAATLTQGVLAIVFCWTAPFDWLFNYSAVGLAILSGLMIACIFILRRRRGYMPTFRVPFYPLTPLLYLAITAWIVVHMIVGEKTIVPSLVGCASILAGFPVYWLLYKKL